MREEKRPSIKRLFPRDVFPLAFHAKVFIPPCLNEYEEEVFLLTTLALLGFLRKKDSKKQDEEYAEVSTSCWYL